VGRDTRQRGRETPSEGSSPGLETPSRTPSEPAREGPGRVLGVGKRNLDDVRGEVRDTTRTKQRRKATVAQKAAREHGRSARRTRPPAGESRPQRLAGSARPCGPRPGRTRERTVAKAAGTRRPKPRRQALPVRPDDFQRLELRSDDGKQRLIDRPNREVAARELPDARAVRLVSADHVYSLDRVQVDALRAANGAGARRTTTTRDLERAGLVTHEPDVPCRTPQGDRVLAQLDRKDSSRDSANLRTDPDSRTIVHERVVLERHYQLTPAQERALSDLGTFRIAREDAISRNVYAHGPHAASQIEQLKTDGLVHQLQKDDATYLALTPAGRDVLQQCRQDRGPIHTGIPRPEQARHDAAVYDAYQHAERAIRAEGGTVRRIQLEEDLKAEIRREAYVSAAKALKSRGLDIKTVTEPERNLAIREATAPIAATHGLPVDDDGAVIYPDMQLEIDRPDGTVGRTNIEVVTEHYSAASVAAKHSAGFSLYVPPVSSGARGGGGGVTVQSLADDLLDF
jgi:hypothetical protein